MKREILVWGVVFLTLLPAYAKKPKTSFDKGADFSQYKTYAWVNGTAAPEPIVDTVIMATVDQELRKAGLRMVEPASADLLVRYDVAGGVVSSSPATDPTYAASGGVLPYTTTAIWTTGESIDTLIKGSLCIQLLDQSKQKVVWSSVVQEGLDDRRPKRLEQAAQAVQRMFKDYPKKK